MRKVKFRKIKLFKSCISINSRDSNSRVLTPKFNMLLLKSQGTNFSFHTAKKLVERLVEKSVRYPLSFLNT
jgi:phage terminase large subunit